MMASSSGGNMSRTNDDEFRSYLKMGQKLTHEDLLESRCQPSPDRNLNYKSELVMSGMN